jgi:hypothetical protein
MCAALLHSISLLGLIGAVAVVTETHNRAKRRRAKASAWAALAVVAWLALVNGMHADPRLGLAAPVIAGTAAFLLGRPPPRRTTHLGPPGHGSTRE